MKCPEGRITNGNLAESSQSHASFLSSSQRTNISHSNMGDSSCICNCHSPHGSHSPDRQVYSPDLRGSCPGNSSWCQELRIQGRTTCLLAEYQLLCFHGVFYTPSVVGVTSNKQSCLVFYRLICMKTMSLTSCSFRGEALTPINFVIPLWLPLNPSRYLIYL